MWKSVLARLGASSVTAVSDTYLDLEYTVVPDFKDGVKLWDDRSYTVHNITGPEMCEGGTYLKPNKHKVSMMMQPLWLYSKQTVLTLTIISFSLFLVTQILRLG